MVNKRQTDNERKYETSRSEHIAHLEKENELLRQNNKVLSLEVTGLKTKMNNLQHEVDSLHEEVFQLQFKNTNMKNYAMKLHNDLKGKLLPNFMNFANECSNMLQENGFKNSPVKQSIKTQAVQPQIVNGNVLYNPTITLRRFDVQNRNTPTEISPEPEQDELVDEPVDDPVAQDASDDAIDGSESSSVGLPEDRLGTILEASEVSGLQNSKFQSEETLKIFLNQIPLNQISPQSDRNEISLPLSAQLRSADSVLSDSGNLPLCTPSVSTNETNSQTMMREFGLSPTNSLATSTPYEPLKPRESAPLNASRFVTKTRGHRSKKVFSTSQEANEYIAQNGTALQSPKLVVQLESMNKENVETTECRESTPKKTRNSRKKKSSTKAVEVKQEVVTPEVVSGRPKRKATPVNLKEPSLMKKMRRVK